MSNAKPPQDPDSQTGLRIRRVCGAFVLVILGLYTTAVLSGLKPDRRIDAATLAVIGLGLLVAAVLFRPDIFDRVTRVQAAGLILEIKEKQQQQGRQLKDIELFLAILLTEDEQKHLLNLDSNDTANYKGRHELRRDLRALAEKHLILRREGKHIGDIKDEATVDLEDYVSLTEVGQRLVARLRQINAEREAEQTHAAGL